MQLNKLIVLLLMVAFSCQSTSPVYEHIYNGSDEEEKTAEESGSENLPAVPSYPDDNGSLENALLGAKIFTTSGETVEGEMDPGSRTMRFRHICRGSWVKNVALELKEGASLQGDLSPWSGNWPANARITILLPEGKTQTYAFELSDFVSDDDPYMPSSDDWTLVWSDEFNAPGIDWGSWSRCTRSSPDWANTMCDREDLGYVEDGELILKAIANPDISKDTSKFLTGGLTGKDKVPFKLGRVDVRAHFTMAQGFWPAIWMMPQTTVRWPEAGEIDIMEHINMERRLHQSVHCAYSKRVTKNDPLNSGKTYYDVDGYILYSVEMHDGYLSFRLDNNLTHTYPKKSGLSGIFPSNEIGQFPFDRYEYYMILSAQVGGKWPGEGDASQMPADMHIDFVRFYSSNNPSDISDEPIYSPGENIIDTLSNVVYAW